MQVIEKGEEVIGGAQINALQEELQKQKAESDKKLADLERQREQDRLEMEEMKRMMAEMMKNKN